VTVVVHAGATKPAMTATPRIRTFWSARGSGLSAEVPARLSVLIPKLAGQVAVPPAPIR
jgi:hypothetical protein